MKAEGPQTIGCCIRNGATQGDWNGAQTFVGEENDSVLDLILKIENEEGSIVNQIVVKPQTESDHLPVEVYFKEKGQEREREKLKGEKKG